MKAFKVIYQHGHFIDKDTNQRVIPVQGGEFIITASTESFTTEDSKLVMDPPLTSAQKAEWASKKLGNKCIKMMNAGEKLFFRVGNSRIVKGDENRQYIFSCQLLEDLYLYCIKFQDGTKFDHWRLADCKCVLDECLLGGMTLTEKVPAESLNQLFSHTVMFYFSLQRCGSANAFRTFFKYEEGMKVYFDTSWSNDPRSLSRYRETIVKKYQEGSTKLS